MPVRSQGKLLAGIAIVLALSTAGVGCHSGQVVQQQAPADSFALRGESEHHYGLVGRLIHRFDRSTPAEGSTMPVQTASGYPGMPVYTAGPVVTQRVMSPAAISTPMPQQPPRLFYPGVAPVVPPASGAGVIASSWQRVEHTVPEAAPPAAAPVRRLDSEGPALSIGREPVILYPTPPGTTVAVSGGPGPALMEVPPEESREGLPQPRIVPHAESVLPDLPPPGVIVHAPPHGAMITGPEGIPPIPREFQKQALPSYVVEPPDILLIQASEAISNPLQPIQGQHLVRPDGTISLGINGVVRVAGLTIEQVKDAIAATLVTNAPRKTKPDPDDKTGKRRIPAEGHYTLEEIKRELDVDVLAYNSKYFYVITDGGGYGAQITRLPVTGNETVLDALAQVNGLPPVASKKRVWLARATQDPANPKIMPVDYCNLVLRGSALTNYQIYPGDRLYVGADPLITADTFLAKLFSPIQRSLGLTLLGSSTVNSIRNSGTGGNGTGTGTGR
jgi:polysaccharide export outer membrane protein